VTPLMEALLLTSAALTLASFIAAIVWGVKHDSLLPVIVSLIGASAAPFVIVACGVFFFGAHRDLNQAIGYSFAVIALLSPLPIFVRMRVHWGIRVAICVSYGPLLAGLILLSALMLACSMHGDCL